MRHAGRRALASAALLLVSATLAAGCASTPPSRYLNMDVYTMAVLPVQSRVDAPHAPASMQGEVERVARARGYRVLRGGVMLEELSQHGVDAAQVAELPPAQLAEWLDVDLVVTTVINAWGIEAAVLGSEVKVEAEFSIYDRKGELFWRRRSWSSKTRRLLGALRNLEPGIANGLCVKVCEQAFRRLKLAGFDPDPQLR